MAQRFYFDTSVFGGVFDVEFEEESLMLFEKVNLGLITCVCSNLTENELANAPKRVQDYFLSIKDQHKEILHVTPESFELAKKYIEEKVVGETSFDDCLHIAMATINKADIY